MRPVAMHRTGSIATGIVALAAALWPSPAAAESALWTLTATPLAATVGQRVTYALTATNADPLAAVVSSSEIGCVALQLPGAFTVHGATVTGTNTGPTWGAEVSGSTVRVTTTSGGNRLASLDWVRFTVSATAGAPGQLTWSARAYRDNDCAGAGALLGIPPVVLVTAPLMPTPVPTPPPTPRPTQQATPSPTSASTPAVTASPAVRPTASPVARPSATDNGPDPAAPPDPTRSPSARPSASARIPAVGGSPVRPSVPPASPSAGEGAATDPAGDGGVGPPAGATGGSGNSGVRVGDADATGATSLAFEPIDLLATVEVWLVPGAAFALPGTLVILVIALQTAGALAWLPAIRRLRDEDQGRPT